MQLFKREPQEDETQKIDNRIAELKPEFNTLSKIDYDLHCKALHANPEDKKAIMEKRAKNSQKLTQIKGKIRTLREKKAQILLEKLIRERSDDFLLYINGQRTKIPQDLNIKIGFSCQKHTITIKAYELISYQTTWETYRSEQLLDKWESLLNSNSTYQRGILCPLCLAEKKKRFEKTSIIQNQKPSGQATIRIQVV